MQVSNMGYFSELEIEIREQIENGAAWTYLIETYGDKVSVGMLEDLWLSHFGDEVVYPEAIRDSEQYKYLDY